MKSALMTRRSFFTTFEISQICEVNPTTVQNWVKEKKLKAYVTPGGHRRIRRQDLEEFLRKFGMPIPARIVRGLPYVLIVDDETVVRDLLTSVMKSGDIDVEVAVAGGGVQALLMIGERKPDLLILDIIMPDLDGFEVCRRLKETPATQGIKIVAITGDHNPAVRDSILKAGADLFCSKPLDVAQFRKDCLKLIRS